MQVRLVRVIHDMSLHIDEDSSRTTVRAMAAAARLRGSLQADDIALADTAAAKPAESCKTRATGVTSAALLVGICVAHSARSLRCVLPATNVVRARPRVQRGKHGVGVQLGNRHREANVVALVCREVGDQVTERALHKYIELTYVLFQLGRLTESGEQTTLHSHCIATLRELSQ